MNWVPPRRLPSPRLETIEFQVIGERRDDPGHLLLMCRDGHWYDYDLASGEIVTIEPTDSWAVDVIDNAAVVARATSIARIAS